jgi:Ni/Co efflux regulator RcnB
MTHRLMIAVAAVTLMAATGFANAQDAGTSRDAPSATAPAQQPRTETLSTRHADPTADRTVGESMKPEKNSGDGDLAAAVRIDQQMSRESEGGLGHRRGR